MLVPALPYPYPQPLSLSPSLLFCRWNADQVANTKRCHTTCRRRPRRPQGPGVVANIICTDLRGAEPGRASGHVRVHALVSTHASSDRSRRHVDLVGSNGLGALLLDGCCGCSSAPPPSPAAFDATPALLAPLGRGWVRGGGGARVHARTILPVGAASLCCGAHRCGTRQQHLSPLSLFSPHLNCDPLQERPVPTAWTPCRRCTRCECAAWQASMAEFRFYAEYSASGVLIRDGHTPPLKYDRRSCCERVCQRRCAS